jgi:hypothetical protein
MLGWFEFLLILFVLAAAITALCLMVFGRGGRGQVVGRRGRRGATGATGDNFASSQVVSFGMAISVPPADNDFAFEPNSTSFPTSSWEPTTTNPVPPLYTTTFLVPQDGSISNLLVRADVRAPNVDVTPQFTYTVWEAATVIGSTGPSSTWNATALTATIPTFLVPASLTNSYGASEVGATGISAPVSAGSLLAMVISPTGYAFFDIQPAYFAASFTFSPTS